MSCDELPCNALPWERLVAYVDGELFGADRDDAARHVDACERCAREADLLERSGAMIARLPGLEPGDAFTARVLAEVVADAQRPAQAAPDLAGATSDVEGPHGSMRSMWPWAAAAAAVLVTTIAVRVWWPGAADTDRVLTAREEQEIAADLYILANLDALEGSEADELISLVDNLDLLEGTETEVSGLFGDLDGEDSTDEGG